MATPKVIADYESQLATAIAIGGTSFTLASATDDDGVALPTGKYYFTLDNGTSNKEYLAGTLSGTSVTSVVSVSRQGVETSGAVRAHRVGSPVILTDFATYLNYMNEVALVSAPDASTTVKGVVEAATLAEVRARTATGATGAALVVTPNVMDDLPTSDQKAALAGTPGTPSSSNPFTTKAKSVTAGATIAGATTPVPVYQSKSDNEFYACDANDTAALKFIGFAISNGTDGNSMNVQFNGVVSGFTGLSEGEKYYVQDAVGTIGTSVGTYEVLVGVAISETELVIQRGKRYASGTTNFTTTTTTAITTGFRPSRVRIHAVTAATNGHAYSNGGWTATGGNDCVYGGFDGTPTEIAGETTSAWYLRADAAAVHHSGTVTTITDTGFTLDNTETTDGRTAYIFWEAEGEL